MVVVCTNAKYIFLDWDPFTYIHKEIVNILVKSAFYRAQIKIYTLLR